MVAKAHVASEHATRVVGQDAANDQDVSEIQGHRDALLSAYGEDTSEVSGEGLIFKEQVDEIKSGDIATLLVDITLHESAFKDRAAVYAEYFNADTPMETMNFRNSLLRHLAGSIVVKDHRNRYQRE